MNRISKIRKPIVQYSARIRNFLKNNSRLLLVILVPLLILLIALIQGNLLVWRLFALSVFVLGANFLVLHFGKKGISGRLINPGHHYQAGWALNSGLPAEDKVAIAKAWTNQAYRRIVTSA
ncbi:MAG: hypothetical protein NUV31_04790, partial [Dehalococcoidales bacterium]|nr:hypothetical protein [Dehalococcoidales bacterium]